MGGVYVEAKGIIDVISKGVVDTILDPEYPNQDQFGVILVKDRELSEFP
jgi:hypothetical protein